MKKVFKNFIMGLAAVAVGTLMLTSCSKKFDPTTSIPDNAIAVFNINLAEIWEKGDLDNVQDLKSMDWILKELKNEDKDAYKIVKEILDDPESTGLNLKSDICCYVDDDLNVVMLAQMDSKSKFSDFLDNTCKKADVKLKKDKKKGVHYAKIKESDDKGAFVWDKKKAAIIIGTQKDVNESRIVKIMDVGKKECIANNDQFMKYWEKRGDISCWVSFGKLLDIVPNNMLNDVDVADIDMLKKGSMYANISFNDGNITLHSELIGVDNKYYEKYIGTFNTNLVKYMPQNTLIAASLNMNLSKMMSELSGQLDLNERVLDNNFTVRELLNSLKGSGVASVYDFTYDMMPIFAMAVDINANETVNNLLYWLESNGVEKRNGYYVIPFNYNNNFYFACNNEAAFLTNDESAANQFMYGGYSNSLAKVADDIKKGNYIYMDLNVNDYPSSITGFIPESVRSILSGYLKNIEVRTTSSTGGEIVINLVGNKNSLASTIKLIDDNFNNLDDLADDLDHAFGNSYGGYDYYNDYPADSTASYSSYYYEYDY